MLARTMHCGGLGWRVEKTEPTKAWTQEFGARASWPVSQPEQPEWNRLGYGNNAIQEVPVRVR
ncbi:MAG TPA: hypothetical protein VN867_16180 [Candidatus Binataceae bacterium]|nr:hypothetical protein [Candidatus Binataceae bacterium]